MRTTIRIDDELYRSVKERAARSGRTVASVLEDALRIGLTEPQATRTPLTIRSSGRGGLRPGVDLTSNAVLAELGDEGRDVDAVR